MKVNILSITCAEQNYELLHKHAQPPPDTDRHPLVYIYTRRGEAGMAGATVTSAHDVSFDSTLQVLVKCFTSLYRGVKRNTANRLEGISSLLNRPNRLNYLTPWTVATKLA